MTSPDAGNSVRREISESPPILNQSVLDWASPNEERDNPGKLDESGRPLASFNELRTREANKEPGNWTVNHAIHVARWEFYQAGNLQAFQPSSLCSMSDTGLFFAIRRLKFMHRMQNIASLVPHPGFGEASDQLVSELEEAIRHAVIALRNGGYCIFKGIKTHYTEMIPDKTQLLAARFSSPTGRFPSTLKQDLERLGCGDCFEFDKNASPTITGEATQIPAVGAGNQAETHVTRIVNASLPVPMKLEGSSVQTILNEATENTSQNLIVSSVEKKRKHDGTIEGRVAALEKQRRLDHSTIEGRVEIMIQGQMDRYKALPDDHTEILDHLAQDLINVDGLADKVKRLKERRAELKLAAPQASALFQGENESHHAE